MKQKRLLLGIALCGLLPTVWISSPAVREIVKETFSPSVYAYPYDLSPSGRARESLTAEISEVQLRAQRNPTDGLELATLAGAYLKMARLTGDDRWYDMAETSAQQSLENLPFNNDGAVVALAKIAEANHDFAEAERLAQQAAGGEAMAIVVTAQLATGQVEAARAGADELVEFSPSLGSLTLRALARQAQGDRVGALEDFQQAIAVEEPADVRGSALARTLLGDVYAGQGQVGLAQALYEEALEIVPQYPQALLNLAALKADQGQYRAAEKYYGQVDDPLALLGLARVKAQQGEMDEARSQWMIVERILREKVAENPLDHGRELAVLLLERRALDFNAPDINAPDFEDVDNGGLTEAIALMEAEVTNRRDAETLETYAWALSEAGRWVDAQRIIEEAIGLGTQEMGLFERAGEIALALEKTAEAEVYFAKARAVSGL